ncbi:MULTISPECIES: type III secretion system stator protein SctL [Phyllobacteriaceae]|uniref:Type 3 secretion system stator protein n=1 Tax=Mesorhizobium japonicum (strain LMG 29417 / CECT 9101 / MAFF 303099) TaxID=266835 RepID=Q989P3_RHILO|nr:MULTISPECIES: type III secretion system stator protein SctL [Phyllobacteriaceae]BAV50404.1 nodulation protein NolV [Mesorhizobium loti]BAB52651.1 nodulation protein; NolV [Mesorhizobium japonicum MAFF 303099]BBD36399.1 nodulation protein NolV [Aminobacter sp. SS-2016]BCG75916.1 nodulation protein NolV [Mesorhizobium sp. 113-1-2]BCG82686.1 nodulation protein NolV [Mesorhizobium sp. 113-3-3]
MTADISVAPAAPQMRPLGPLIPASELEIWDNAAKACAAAERHQQHVRSWARAAYQRELARGHTEGLNAGAEEMAALISQAVAEVARRKAVLEQQLPQLVLEILSELLGAFDPGELLVMAVRHAIERQYSGAEVCLHVYPTQVDMLAREFAGWDGQDGRPRVRIKPDPTLSPRRCVLWSEYGNVDLGLDAQMRALRLGFGSLSEKGEL